MSNVCTVMYDHLEQDPWKPNNTADVNPIPLDDLDQGFITSGQFAGSLIFMGKYKKNMAGGLLSNDIVLPVIGTRKFLYSAMNVKQWMPDYSDLTFVRNELDYKWTVGAPNTPNQANVSTQIKDNSNWQLDPTGKVWVDSGCIVNTAMPGQWNVFQIRAWTDGTKWSVTGLKCNSEPTFVPGPAFKNIPMLNTSWAQGLHPQLQWEGINAPFSAVVYYGRVQILTSEAPIPMFDSTTLL